jgi:thiol-disulfide isomerase/thioredoxin
MKPKHIILLILTIFLGLACSKPIQISDCDGNKVDLDHKWLVVNYWADWCSSCLTELPELNKLAQQNFNLAIIGVNFDALSNAKIKNFKEHLHLSIPLSNNFPKEKFGIGDIATLPVTFLISPQGTLVKRWDGPQRSETLLAAIQQYSAQ